MHRNRAFYPFSRDHTALGTIDQELYLWDSVAEAARTALGMRYQLLPYLYSALYSAHSAGTMVTRALWMNFPSDTTALTVDRQFMLGDYLMVSPVLDEGVTTVSAYFPEGAWYSFADRNLTVVSPAGGSTRSIFTPLTSTNVHVLGGGILPLQRAALTTVAGRLTPFTLLVALATDGTAQGELFYDDGEQIELSNNLRVSYSASAGSLSGVVSEATYSGAATLEVEAVIVMGTEAFTTAPTVTLNGQAVSAAQVQMDGATLTVTLDGALLINSDFTLSW